MLTLTSEKNQGEAMLCQYAALSWRLSSQQSHIAQTICNVSPDCGVKCAYDAELVYRAHFVCTWSLG
jgi:hypothetical protein